MTERIAHVRDCF